VPSPNPEPTDNSALLENERAVKVKELEVRRLEADKALLLSRAPWWRKADPLVLAIVAAIFTMIGNMLVAIYNNNATIRQEEQKNRNSLSQIEQKASDDLGLEHDKAAYTLILQAIATNDKDIAKRNIEFFIDAGLLKDPGKKIQEALAKFSPVLPGPAGAGNPPASLRVPEIARLYNFPTELDGEGQTIGLLEFGGGINPTDLKKYFRSAGLQIPNVVVVPVNGAKNDPEDLNATSQVMFDIEVVGNIAPKANIRVYFAPWGATGFVAAIGQAVTDKVSVLHTSWGESESEWKDDEISHVNNALEDAARRGITITAAAGDDGVTDGEADNRPHVTFPASSPWVLAVGGTSIILNSGQLVSEVAWKMGTGLRMDGGGSTGGGVSEKFPAPDWQSALSPSSRSDSKVGRGVPDVAATADANVVVRFAGTEQKNGGTGMSAAIWAGLIALLDQGLGHQLGYFNPRLYQEIGPAGVLRPVTKGDNGVAHVQGYMAGPGWNPVTGWGTPDGQKLLDWLRSHP
jgi:kumamolisin